MRHFLSFIYLCALTALLVACGGHSRGEVHPPYTSATGQPTVSSTLWAIGVYGIWCGSVVTALCVLAGVGLAIGLVTLSPLLAIKARSYVVDGAILGACLILLGCVTAYLGEHIWLVALSVGLVCVVLGVRYRTTIEADVGAIAKG